MSVYIPGMEMPEDEAVGLFLYPDGTVHVWRKTSAVGQEYDAIAVPEHGRLIDADALHEELCALEYARENEWLDGVREARGVDAARVALLDAPTIIPESRGSEDE